MPALGFFPPIRMCFTLFYVLAEVSRGRRSMLKLSEFKNVVWGWVFRRVMVTLQMWPILGEKKYSIRNVFKF